MGSVMTVEEPMDSFGYVNSYRAQYAHAAHDAVTDQCACVLPHVPNAWQCACLAKPRPLPPTNSPVVNSV